MKRSTSITLVMMASVSMMATLSGCGEPQQDSPPADKGGTFTTMAECVAVYDQQTCQSAQTLAQQDHLHNAPHFNSQNDCIAQYGADQCRPASTYGGAGNVWMPLMAGYMLGSAMSRPAPLYYGTIEQRRHYTGGSAPIFTSGNGFSHSAPIGAAPFASSRPAIGTKAGLNSTTALTPPGSARGGFGSSFKPAPTFTTTYAKSNPSAFGKTAMPATSTAARSFASSRASVSAPSASARGGFGSVGRSFGGSMGG